MKKLSIILLAFLFVASAACGNAGMGEVEPPPPNGGNGQPGENNQPDENGNGENGENGETPPEDDSDKPVIALTFDDGPNMTTTVQILDKLEEYGVIASFFVVGREINDSTAEVIKRAFDMGCEIGNHSRSHSRMNTMEEDVITAQMEYTSDKIKEITGQAPAFFRPPYISMSALMHEVIDLPFIGGLMANDWDGSTDAEGRADRVLKQVKDGSIILLHDFTGNDMTVEALDIIIPALLEEGYKFVTVSDLFAIKEVTPEPHSGIIHNSVN